MIPRTVLMAQEIAAQFTPTELDDYGNIILNGYQSTVANTINKKAWQYSQTATPPVNLPSLTAYTPAMKGWTTNYMSYFTRTESNYSAYSGQGNPFLFDIWNYYQNPGPIGATGPLLSVAGGLGGNDLLPGQHLVSVSGATSGYGAVLNFTVQFADPADPTSGAVTQILVVSGGSDYTPGDILPVTSLPTVSGLPQPDLKASVGSISSNTVIPAAGYSQCPRRFYQNQAADFVPPTANQQAIAYSFIYPVADSITPPPIDSL